MLATCLTATHIGVEGRIVEVECDNANSLPGIVIVGLANKAVDEAKERIRSAIKNSQLQLPAKRFTVNLAPADVPKEGTGFDLAIAVSILISSGQISQEAVKNTLFCGELSLSGDIKPINGILLSALAAKAHGVKNIVVSPDNASEASLVKGLQVFPAASLKDVYRHFIDEAPILVHSSKNAHTRAPKTSQVKLFDQIRDQEQAKRALIIAAAGGHNLLMNGPPGSGKTMLARALNELLPPLTHEEMIQVTQIHSVAGTHKYSSVTERPFRSPHHSTSHVALVGGGRNPLPGEVSLSNHGVLFLDELPEYSRQALESLRQPLEDRMITISRANGRVIFPAQFILIGTQNPCPCGYATDNAKECTCSAAEIVRYNRKISGPLLDRFDMCLEVARISTNQLLDKEYVPNASSASEYACSMVQKAREIQMQRFKKTSRLNAHMSNRELTDVAQLENEAKILLDKAADKLKLSARAYLRTVKVARTIADLEEHSTINSSHISEALQYRLRKEFI